jgi:ribosomal protein S18 acetylase RimI-like enzyme
VSVGYFELTLPDETCRPIIIRETKPDEMLAIEWLRYTELDQPLGLPLDVREDQKKDNQPGSLHVAAFDGATPVGTLRVERLDENQGYIRRLAVAHEVRGLEVGRSCLQYAAMLASERGLKRLSLHARPEIPPHFRDTQPYFRMLGYTATGSFWVNYTGSYPHMAKDL